MIHTCPVVVRRSSNPNTIGTPDPAADRALRLRVAQSRLHVDAFTVEVVRALGGHGVRAILMKGPAVANWLYHAAEPRSYIDADLLVDPLRLADAEQVLDQLGFERLVDDRLVEAFAEPHAVTWKRQRDRGAVDLHWRIPGIAADPRRAWERLSSGTEDVCVAGTAVEALGKPARALHLALHALQNGRENEQSVSDLARGVERVDEQTWRLGTGLAAELEATAPFAAGLRLTPEGAVLADRLGLPSRVPTRWALWAQTPPTGAVRLHDFATTPGIWAKARLLGAALAPSPAYMRGLYPSARRSSYTLALAYLRRPLAGIRKAPSALRALRQARAEARASERGT